jgi:hypothetical protein
VDISGNTTLKGQILAKKEVTLNGNVTVTAI